MKIPKIPRKQWNCRVIGCSNTLFRWSGPIETAETDDIEYAAALCAESFHEFLLSNSVFSFTEAAGLTIVEVEESGCWQQFHVECKVKRQYFTKRV